MTDITGIDAVQNALKRLQDTIDANVRRGLARCGFIAAREAKDNAPCSPTMKKLSATLKRKKRTKDKKTPGGLEKSIFFEVNQNGTEVSVFVPYNALCVSHSKNGRSFNYAKRIHDEKGKTWRNRGPGTIAKGARADEKFIDRAIRDNTGKFTDIFEDEISKAVASV